MDYNVEVSGLAPTADPYMTVSRPTRRPTRAHEAARNRSGRATTAATVAVRFIPDGMVVGADEQEFWKSWVK